MSANKQRLRKLERENERLSTALQIILTWATFQHGDLPKGHLLNPEDTARVCQEALGK